MNYTVQGGPGGHFTSSSSRRIHTRRLRPENRDVPATECDDRLESVAPSPALCREILGHVLAHYRQRRPGGVGQPLPR